MKMITTNEEYEKMKCRELVTLQCELCGALFTKTKHSIRFDGRNDGSHSFCKKECYYKHFRDKTHTELKCAHCNKTILKANRSIKKSLSGRSFCGSSCAASYNNINKTHGTRVSKLEIFLANKLTSLFPLLEFHFNRKDTINSELDIYIPSLKLAFELNGIFHYEPIYGAEKLAQIQNNDGRKYQACLEKGIELCIIDSSRLSYFTEKGAAPYLSIISNLISKKLTAA